MMFSAKNYASQASFGKVIPKIVLVRFFKHVLVVVVIVVVVVVAVVVATEL